MAAIQTAHIELRPHQRAHCRRDHHESKDRGGDHRRTERHGHHRHFCPHTGTGGAEHHYGRVVIPRWRPSLPRRSRRRTSKTPISRGQTSARWRRKIANIAVAQISTANINQASIDWANIASLNAQIAHIRAGANHRREISRQAHIDWREHHGTQRRHCPHRRGAAHHGRTCTRRISTGLPLRNSTPPSPQWSTPALARRTSTGRESKTWTTGTAIIERG